MFINFRTISFTSIVGSIFVFGQNAGAIYDASEPSIFPYLRHNDQRLEPRNLPLVGPPATDWRDKPAPQIFCTPSAAKEVRVVGVAVLKDIVGKAWLTGDPTSVQLLLYDHTCQLLNQTVIGGKGYKNYNNFVRWDMDRNSAVTVSMDIMPTYQSAGYCPGGYNCTEMPSYWACGPSSSSVPTTTCSVTQGRLNIKTFAWGAGGNTRDQYSDMWVSSATPKDACNCHAGSAENGLPDEYVYGCRCNINPDMVITMDGESSTGCREESRIGYCPADPDPYAFQPAIPPPWKNSPGRFPATPGPNIPTPVKHHPLKSTSILMSHTLSLHLPHILGSSIPTVSSSRSSLKSKSSLTTSSTIKHPSSTAIPLSVGINLPHTKAPLPITTTEKVSSTKAISTTGSHRPGSPAN